MPSEIAAKRLPPDALDAFLDGILAELREPSDPAALNEIRSAFRKRVPFHLRSYAAAALILRAAGISRPQVRQQGLKDSGPKGRGRAPKPRQEARQEAGQDARQESRPKDEGEKASRPRYTGDATTLFFSMGKRQRLYPRILIDLIIEVGSLGPESIGDVRAFDNYSFVDIEPARAESLITALDGYEYRGRKLSVGPAKKRDGQEEAVE